MSHFISSDLKEVDWSRHISDLGATSSWITSQPIYAFSEGNIYIFKSLVYLANYMYIGMAKVWPNLKQRVRAVLPKTKLIV